jgi:hypothetical protein
MGIKTDEWVKKLGARRARAKIAAWKGKVTASGGGVVVRRFDAAGQPVPPPYARLDRDVYFGKGQTLHYAYRPQYRTKHIDIHPLARTRRQPVPWPTNADVYLCLEGSLKADAVLSAGYRAISSTSVTTWESKDLKQLVPFLKNAHQVYVVPDSDFYVSDKFSGYFNPAVLYFTRLAAQWLHYRGVPTKIAIPWCQEA